MSEWVIQYQDQLDLDLEGIRQMTRVLVYNWRFVSVTDLQVPSQISTWRSVGGILKCLYCLMILLNQTAHSTLRWFSEKKSVYWLLILMVAVGSTCHEEFGVFLLCFENYGLQMSLL